MAGNQTTDKETGVKVILLDIEGTVCPISFVKDVLFPYALNSLTTLLSTPDGWESPSFIPYRDAFPAEHRTSPPALLSHVHDLMARDVKIAYLKSLQGYLWLQGYESGTLMCPLFPDVYPAFQRWRAAGIKIAIYSSGSVAAQKLLFQYTTDGDLRGLVGGEGGDSWWDTVNAGLKTEVGSYEKILKGLGFGEGEGEGCLFFSDRVVEVEAARSAGMKSRLVVRKGNEIVQKEVMSKLGAVKEFGEVKINGV